MSSVVLLRGHTCTHQHGRARECDGSAYSVEQIPQTQQAVRAVAVSVLELNAQCHLNLGHSASFADSNRWQPRQLAESGSCFKL